MVIGMEEGFSGQFIPPMSNDFIDIHVALGPTAGLPHCQREVAVQFSLQDLVADLANDLAAFLVQLVQGFIGLGSTFFQVGKSPDHFHGHLFRPNLEILEAPF